MRSKPIWMLAGLLSGLVGGTGVPNVAFAQDTNATAAAEPARRFASVWRIRGEVTATTGESGRPRRLQEGDPVFVGERVSAQTSAEAVLKTDDAGLMALRPGGSFMAERFSAEGQPGDHMTVRLLSGALRMVTGWIGRGNRADYRILTPSATIGIRGTDHEPYVMTAELATASPQTAGTYDKVNRGGTTLEASGRQVDIDPGKVGFVRSARPVTTRALMTLLLPVLLDKVPDFFVPGEFDGEVDQLSALADDNALKQLEEKRNARPAAPAGGVSVSPGGATAPVTIAAAIPAAGTAGDAAAPRNGLQAAACGAHEVAKSWLAQLDTAVARRNAPSIVRMFAPQAVVQATLRGQDGAATTVEIGRDEFVQSTVAAAKGLSEFRQRRPSIEGQPELAGSCERISVKSVVIEQGKQAGKPYRFESLEEFVLERRAGRWLAIRASTTQR